MPNGLLFLTYLQQICGELIYGPSLLDLTCDSPFSAGAAVAPRLDVLEVTGTMGLPRRRYARVSRSSFGKKQVSKIDKTWFFKYLSKDVRNKILRYEVSNIH